MDTTFRGAAKRLDDIDLPCIGAQIGVGEDELHAFIDVETRGSGFDDQGRPAILFERQKFYEYVPAAKRDAAVKAGLANKTPGGYGKEERPVSETAQGHRDRPQGGALFLLRGPWPQPQARRLCHGRGCGSNDNCRNPGLSPLVQDTREALRICRRQIYAF